VVGRWIDEGRLRVELDTTLPLEAAAEADALVEHGRVRGKVALGVAPR